MTRTDREIKGDVCPFFMDNKDCVSSNVGQGNLYILSNY